MIPKAESDNKCQMKNATKSILINSNITRRKSERLS